ncbi:hypothetical protein HY357_00710 [Candidatus Roizmanbacteria bacterium]|nr:hypothetical protein [Candidatus Roizmanbacteria bacterium]
MSETSPIPRPIPRVGSFDWNIAPDVLFNNAFNLISKARQNSIINEALQMVITLKRKEAVKMAQQMMVEDEAEYLASHQEDAMFTKRGLANNRKRLRKYEKEISNLLKQYEARKSKNPALLDAYGEVETSFNQMLVLIAPNRQEMEIGAQASFQSDLLKLINFYLKSD